MRRLQPWVVLAVTVALAVAAVVLGARHLQPLLTGGAGSTTMLWGTLTAVALLAGGAGLVLSVVTQRMTHRRVVMLHDALGQLGEANDLPDDMPVAISPPGHAMVPLARAVAAARQRAQRTFAALTAEAMRAQAMIDTVSASVFVVDGGGRIVSANAAAAQLFDRGSSGLVGCVLSDIIAPESLRMTVDEYGSVRLHEASEAPRFTTSLRRFGRPAFAAEVSMRALAVEGQRAWAVCVHDLTVERQVAASLQEARRAAEIANGARMLFLSRMGQELRAPLNSIVSMTRLVRQSRGSQLGDRDRASLDRAQRVGEQLQLLVSDLLDLTHIESGGLALQVTETDVAPIVTEVLAQFEDNVAGRPVLLESELPGGPAMATVDAARLRQVLTHLVGNAVKFTARGSVLVSVRLNQETGRASAILVRDTGIGIALDEQSRIFEKFAQAGGDTSQRYGGTGLGLALSRGIAQQMRCTLSVESMPGAGSTFTLTFAPAGSVAGAVPGESPTATHATSGSERQSLVRVAS